MTDICPACDVGVLAARETTRTLRYGKVSLAVHPIRYSLCPNCGEEVVLAAQAKHNERRYSDAKRVHDGLMTSDEIVAWRELWGMTQAQASALLGGGANAFSKYERGEVIQSRAMDLLMRAFNEIGDLRRYLANPARLAKFEPSPIAASPDLISPLARLWAGEHLEDFGTSVDSWIDCSTMNLVIRPIPTAKPVRAEKSVDRSVVNMQEWAARKVPRKVWTTVEPMHTHGTLQ